MTDEAQALITRLQLEPLPLEGGFFRRTWSSSTKLPGGRAAGASIYFVLTDTDFSAFHLLQTDELWVIQAGDPVEHVQLFPGDPNPRVTSLGIDVFKNEAPQVVVRGGCWQGARLRPREKKHDDQAACKGWALLSCIMAPEWDEREFTLGATADLLALFPLAEPWIRSLTR